MRKRTDPLVRFWRHVNKTDGCWKWTGAESHGYGIRYCGASPSDGIRLVVDHIVPVADGGTDDWDNLAAACHECNAGKGRHPLIRPKTETQ